MLLPFLLYPSYIWPQAVAQVPQDVGAWQLHWSWEPRIYVPWWRTFRWKMKVWQVKWRSPDSHSLPHYKMSAAVCLCWLSLLVLSSHSIVQIDLCRLTFQWTSIVLFNEKSCYLEHRKKFLTKNMVILFWWFLMRSFEALFEQGKWALQSYMKLYLKTGYCPFHLNASEHLFESWWAVSLCLKSVIHSSCKRRYCPTQLLLSG